RGADPIVGNPLAPARLAGALEQNEAQSLAGSLLVPADGGHHSFDVDAWVERGRETVPAEDRLDLVAKVLRAGDASRRERPEPHRLAVAVALVVRLGFDRVADGVAEVEDCAASRVPLVIGHHLDLGPRAVEDDVSERLGVQAVDLAHAVPERA